MDNATDSIACSVFGWGCKTGTIVHQPEHHLRQRHQRQPASAAVDAQYGTAMTWDYFKCEHGRNGIFGNGSGSYNRVHYGQNYVNAFWDGTKMTYGDGDGVELRPAGLPRRGRPRDDATASPRTPPT